MRMTLNSPCTLRRLPRGCSSLLALALVMGVCLPVRAQDSEVISKVEVQGALRQPVDTILYKAGIKEGDDLRNMDLTAILDRLWATGAFEDVKFETEDIKGGGKKLLIKVVERPIIKEVDYRGGTEVGLSSIKDKVKEKKLNINPDTVYDPEMVRKIKALIVEEAADKGYRNPLVEVSLEPMSPGVSRLVFDIKEGGKVRIYKIVFRGNKVISSSTLKSVMKKTREHWMFSWLTSHDKLVDKTMEEDLKNVKEAYWRLGYKDVFVGQPTIEVQDKTSDRQKKKNVKKIEQGKSPYYDMRATLTIPILEGDKFYEGTFKLEGNDKVMIGKQGEQHVLEQIAIAHRDGSSYLKKFLNIKPDTKPAPADKPRVFDLDALNKGLDKVREEYSNLGYIRFGTNKKLEVREENGVKKVDVQVKMDEGEIYTIRHINFEGNTTTKDKVLRRSLMVREGDPFRLEAFKESFTGLGQLGFFDVKGEEPKVDLVEDKPQVDITIKGEEAGVNELLFNGGFGSVFGFTLGLTFSTRNFGGGGETLSLSYQGGQYSRGFNAGFVEPYVLDLPYSLSVNVGNSTTDYDASKVGEAYAYKQTMKTIGTSVGTKLSTFMEGRRQDWAFWTTLGLGYSYRLIDIDGGQSYIYRDNYKNLLTSSVNASVTYNTINHPFKPTNGTKIQFVAEYGGWQFGTDRPFYRTNWEFTKWTNVADRHIFGMNFTYGYLKNLSDESIAVYDLFRPGGENSIRGYRYGQIGEVVNDNNDQPLAVGGNKQFIANFEYQLKVADQFRIVAFFDAGNAWGPGSSVFSRVNTTYSDIHNNGAIVHYTNPVLMESTGLEVRFFLPISPAPMRLIWAKKLNPYPWDTNGKTDFQFSIGTTF